MSAEGAAPDGSERSGTAPDGSERSGTAPDGSERSGTAPDGSGGPSRVLVAGDWHGNTAWAASVIRQLPDLLPDEHPRFIIHCGDFGIWPGVAGERYLHKLNRELEKVNGMLWFVDGNHECFPLLDQMPRVVGMGWVKDRIWHLPRGHRWTWHDRTWLALGGAVSLDKATRTEGKSWWPDEEITPAQAAEVINGGFADVMVTHDCPSGVAHTFPSPPRLWAVEDLIRGERHRRRLQQIMEFIRPAHLIHGHLHRAYARTTPMRWGDLEVTGLDCDESGRGNWAVLDVQHMQWNPGSGAGSADAGVRFDPDVVD